MKWSDEYVQRLNTYRNKILSYPAKFSSYSPTRQLLIRIGFFLVIIGLISIIRVLFL